MGEILHTFSHILGFCGEGHVKLFDLLPFFSYINKELLDYRLYYKSVINKLIN